MVVVGSDLGVPFTPITQDLAELDWLSTMLKINVFVNSMYREHQENISQRKSVAWDKNKGANQD